MSTVPTTNPAPMQEARSFSLGEDKSRQADLERILLGRISRALEEFTETSRDDLGKGIHEGRKQLKKTRSMLRLLRKGGLDGETYRFENDRYRQVGRRLGPARDGEVKLGTLAGLQDDGLTLPRGKLVSWRSSLENEREAALGRAREIDLPWAVEQLEAGFARADAWSLPAEGFGLVEPGLKRAYRRGRKRLAELHERRDGERAHELRKRVKDLWYMLDVLSPLWPAVLEPSAEEAHELSSLLGDHHDLTVIAADARSRESDLGTEAIEAVDERVAAGHASLLEEAMPLAERLYCEKPKAFRRRLEGYWNAGRH